jgi:peptide/nickel transport system permease protein
MRGVNRLLVGIAVFWVLMIAASLLTQLEPNRIVLADILQPPGPGLWFGADDLGRAVFDRLMAGAGLSLMLALLVVMVSLLAGVVIGAISAYAGGIVDTVITRLIDIFLAFPGILLAIALAGILGPGLINVVIALSVVGWVGFARLTRAQVLSIRHYDHVIAAQALGQRTAVILFRHIVPLALTPIIVEGSFALASVMIAEAGLSFLGLGVQPPQASWGSMIRDGSRYLLVAPHLTVIPGLALMSVVVFFNLAGDALRDWLDVH